MKDYIEQLMKTAGVKPVYIVKENREGCKIKATFPIKKMLKAI